MSPCNDKSMCVSSKSFDVDVIYRKATSWRKALHRVYPVWISKQYLNFTFHKTIWEYGLKSKLFFLTMLTSSCKLSMHHCQTLGHLLCVSHHLENVIKQKTGFFLVMVCSMQLHHVMHIVNPHIVNTYRSEIISWHQRTVSTFLFWNPIDFILSSCVKIIFS